MRQLNHHSPMLNPFTCKNSRSALIKHRSEKQWLCNIFRGPERYRRSKCNITEARRNFVNTATWLMFYPVLMKIQHFLLDRPENSICMYISAEDAVHWSSSAEIVNIAVQMHKFSFIICIFANYKLCLMNNDPLWLLWMHSGCIRMKCWFYLDFCPFVHRISVLALFAFACKVHFCFSICSWTGVCSHFFFMVHLLLLHHYTCVCCSSLLSAAAVLFLLTSAIPDIFTCSQASASSI